MGHIYKESIKLFDNHILECKDKLNNNMNFEYCLNQIDVKKRHSYRVTYQMKKIFDHLLLGQDYVDLAKTIGIFHDIGRFRQMVETGTYSDASSFVNVKGINDHGDYGVKILFGEKLIKSIDIESKYYLVMHQAIKYHGKLYLPKHLRFKLDYKAKPFDKIELEEFLSLCSKKDINYLKLLSLYAQAIRDADKVDIYYQQVTGEFPVVRPYFNYGPKGDSLSTIAKNWGITEQELKNYNELENDNISQFNLLKIPVSNIDPKRLEIPKELISQFFKGEIMDFKSLVKQRWYTFITASLIRLNFLRDINFISTLIYLQQHQIIEKIYQNYPSKYKPLVADIFAFAKEELIDKPIKQNKDKIYVK